jgi:glycosyltransferase involved in cell wall biosynthesis
MLSAVVITFNEAAKIADCIDSLKQVCNDIVVIDSFSTDATPQICQAKGVNFLQRAWTGYSDQKNYGNDHARHSWVLSLDADERLSPELVAEINQLFANGNTPQADVYDLRFLTHFCGKPIRHGGWNPESHIRLFNKEKIRWNADAVHEGLTLIHGHRIEQLKGYVWHFTVDTHEAFVAKTDRYSSLFAEKSVKAGKKASWFKIILSPIVRFMREYIVKMGFLDGWAGWFIAKENTRYTFLKYWKMR